MLSRRALHIHPADTVLVALGDLDAGEVIDHPSGTLTLVTRVPAKHKLLLHDLAPGDPVIMYGVLVGRATQPIARGAALTTANVRHDATPVHLDGPVARPWTPPDTTRFAHRTFEGFLRADGRVGTRNLWLVLPLVFCENRNVRALQAAFDRELGCGRCQRDRPAFVMPGTAGRVRFHRSPAFSAVVRTDERFHHGGPVRRVTQSLVFDATGFGQRDGFSRSL